MATTIIKQGTNLAQTSDEEAKKLGQLDKEAGFSPITPAGAKAIGANPDVAKMAPTPARKQAMNVQPKPEQTLQQAQRLTPNTATPIQAPDEDAATKLERMKSMGSINMQMENLVKQKQNAVMQQQAQLQLNTTAIGALPSQQQTGLTAALNAYKSATTEPQKEAAILAASNALGRLVTPDEMAGYFQGEAETLKGAFAPTTVTVRDLGLQNTAQLATDLGVPEEQLLAYTPAQLKASIQQLENRQYNQVQNLQAQLLTATGNRRQQIQQELASLAASGVASREASFDVLQSAIENGDTVTFNGQPTTVEELLGGGMSQMIANAVDNPGVMAELERNEPELANWIKANKATLQQLVADTKAEAEKVGQTQAGASDLRKSVSAPLFETLFGKQPELMTADELSQLQASTQNSALWQRLSKDADFKARLERHPELANSLKGLDETKLSAAINASKIAEADGNLAAIAGYTPGGVPSEAQAATIAQWAPVFDQLAPSITADKDFQNAVKSGKITTADAQRLVNTPQLWQKVKDEKAAGQELRMAGSDPQKLLSLFMGADVDMGQFNKGMERLEAYANMGDQEARDYYVWLKQNLLGDNGRLGPEDVEKLQTLGASAQNPDIKAIVGGGATFSDILKSAKTKMANGASFQTEDTTKRTVLPYVQNDGVIDDTEAQELMSKYGPDQMMKLLESPWIAQVMPSAEVWKSRLGEIKDERNLHNAVEDVKQYAAPLQSSPLFKNLKMDSTTGVVTADYDFSKFDDTNLTAAIKNANALKEAMNSKLAGLGPAGQGRMQTAMASVDTIIKKLETEWRKLHPAPKSGTSTAPSGRGTSTSKGGKTL